MSSMLPTLSLMLSDAGASLMGQLAVEGTAAVVTTSSTAAVSAAAEVSGTGAAERPEVHFHGQQMLAGLQVLLVVRTGAGEQPCVDLIEIATTAHHGAQVLPIVGEGDRAPL